MDLIWSSQRKTPPSQVWATLQGPKVQAFTLQRAWPSQDGNAAAQYQSVSGLLVAARWFGDPLDAASEHTRTPGSVLQSDDSADQFGDSSRIQSTGQVVLYPDGVDRKLHGLATLARQGRLLAHRPQRRAVLAMPADSEFPAHYLKILRIGKTQELVNAHEILAEIARAGIELPHLLEHQPAFGWTRWSTVPGETLYRLMTCYPAQTFDENKIWREVGKLIAVIHDSSGNPNDSRAEVAPSRRNPDAIPASKVHGPSQEAEVIRNWLTRAAQHGVLQVDPRLVETVINELVNTRPGPRGVIHRDLHDKQILVATGESELLAPGNQHIHLGVVDVDTVALGERALDLGNLLAHIELRQVQGLVSTKRAELWASALLSGYDPSDEVSRRIDPYRAGTILRLAAVYAFRPAWRDIVRRWASSELGRHLGLSEC